MLGLILIYYVGKKFYDLASEYNKNKWGFAIAGVVSYYAFTWIGALAIALLWEINSPGFINESNERWLGLLGIPVGVLACWIFYRKLEKSWSIALAKVRPDTLDGDMITSDRWKDYN